MWMFIAWDSLASKKILTWATGQDQFDAWCVEMFRCLRWKFFFCFAIESTEGVKFIWYDTVSSESLYICCVELQSRQSCPDIHKMQHEAVVFYNNQCYARYMSYLAASLPFLDSFSWINLSCTLDVCITSSDFSLLSRQKGLYSTCVVGAWVYWSGNRYRGRPMDVGLQPLRTLMSVWRTLCHLDDELWYVVMGIFTGWNWCFQVPWRFWHSWALNFLVCSMDIQLFLHLLNFYLSRWPRGYVTTFRSELLVDFGHDPDLQANIRQACKCLVKWMFWITLCMSARGLLKCFFVRFMMVQSGKPKGWTPASCSATQFLCKEDTSSTWQSNPAKERLDSPLPLPNSIFIWLFWPRYGLAAIFYFYLSMEDTSPGMSLSCTTAPNSAAGCCDASPLRRVTWSVIKDKGLLTETEIKRVSDFPGTVPGALDGGENDAFQDVWKWWKWWKGVETWEEISYFSWEGDVLRWRTCTLFVIIVSTCKMTAVYIIHMSYVYTVVHIYIYAFFKAFHFRTSTRPTLV